MASCYSSQILLTVNNDMFIIRLVTALMATMHNKVSLDIRLREHVHMDRLDSATLTIFAIQGAGR